MSSAEVESARPAGRSAFRFTVVIVVLVVVLVVQLVALKKLTATGNGSRGAGFGGNSVIPAGGAATSGAATTTAGTPPTVFLGPIPTAEPSTWLLAPGDCLNAALKQVATGPGTRLTSEQAQRFLEVIPKLRAGSAIKPAAVALISACQAALNNDQLAAIAAHEKAILDGPFDAVALVRDLQTKAARPSDASPPPPAPVAFTYSGPFLLAGISFLEKSGRTALTPAQARQLQPTVATLVKAYQERATAFPSLVKIFNADQMRAFVAALVTMRRGTVNLDAAKTEVNQLKTILQVR